MNIRFLPVALFVSVPLASGQVSIPIGGPGSLASANNHQCDDPGLLGCDVGGEEACGVVAPTALYTFSLEDLSDMSGTLVVRVDNTSTVLDPENNAILTDIYFNAPADDICVSGVDGIRTMGPVSVDYDSPAMGGPTFEVHFNPLEDCDGNGNADHPNSDAKADGFANFNVSLRATGGINGIVNPDASDFSNGATTGTGATFRIVFYGEGFLTAHPDEDDPEDRELQVEDFTDKYSMPPPPGELGNRLQVAAAKFQGAGACGESGFISPPNEDLAVDLDFFRIHETDGAITLGWRTLTEIDNAGFNVWRQPLSVSPTGEVIEGLGIKLNPTLIPAQGNLFLGATYVLQARPGGRPAQYWLEDIDINGLPSWHGPIFAQH